MSESVVIDQPALILVGAQKAATTWLADNLQTHDAFAFSFLKEIHYFNNIEDGRPSPYLLERTARKAASRHLPWLRGRREWRDYLRHSTDPKRVGTDAWYRDLFLRQPRSAERLRTGRPTVFCDFTPAYMTMAETGFRHMRRLLPNARFLLVIRDPVKRMVSGFSMSLTRHSRLRTASIAERIAHLEATQVSRGDYRHVVSTFEALDMPLTVAAFKDVLESPESLQKTLESQFGLDNLSIDWDRKRKLNSHTGRHPLEPELLDRVEQICRPQYDFLRSHFGEEFLRRV